MARKKETSPKQHSQDGSKKVIAPQEGRVTGSSPEIIKLLEKLIHQLEDMGAEFHPGMVIKEEGGELSVFCHQKISNLEKFMNVPLTAMPLTADYRFSLEQDDKLVATPKKHRVSPKNVHIMETIVELFNATDKLGKWRKTYPIFKLAGKHKLANKLFHAKSHNQKYLKYFAQSHEEVTDESVIDSFLGSRTFAFRDSDMKRAGIKLKTPRQQGIIPLIELINHKISAPPFVIDHKSPYLSTFVADMESDEEVYVQYNLDDPVITFIVYGFIDTSAPWIYSVPVTLYSSLGQEIKISNLIGSLEAGKLPDNLKHLSTFVPSQSITVQNTINWSSLIIPKVEEQDIILKVLGYLIRTSYGVPECDDPGWVENEAEYLLRKLIKYNIQYWQEMSDLLNQTQDLDKDASELISQLCNLCLSMVKRYSQHNAYLLRA